MPFIVNLHEAKIHFSKLINRVMSGEEIIIAKTGTPVARLVPFQRNQTQREPGSAKGMIEISPDFDNPFPDEILNLFES